MSRSNTKVEYKTLANVVAEIIWVKSLLETLQEGRAMMVTCLQLAIVFVAVVR